MEAKNYLPQSLQDKPLFVLTSDLLQKMLDEYHFADTGLVEGRYKFQHDDYSPDWVSRLLTNSLIAKLSVPEDNKEAVSLLASSILSLKGTERGLKFILAFVGYRVDVDSWYEINVSPGGAAAFGFSGELTSCSVVLTVHVSVHAGTSIPAIQAVIEAVAEDFFWVCMKIKYRWALELWNTYPYNTRLTDSVDCHVDEYIKDLFPFSDACNLLVYNVVGAANSWKFGPHNGGGSANLLFGYSTDEDSIAAGCRGMYGRDGLSDYERLESSITDTIQDPWPAEFLAYNDPEEFSFDGVHEFGERFIGVESSLVADVVES